MVTASSKLNVDPMRVGLVGMGFGARVLLPALLDLPNVKVVALADAGSGRAAAAAAPMGAAAYDDGVALIRAAVIDAVVIAAPPAAQARLVEAALQREMPVYCEKPLGLTLADTERLTAKATENHMVTAVGFSMRYDRGVGALIDVVRRDEIGPVRRIAVTWTTAGGADPRRTWSWRDDPDCSGGILEEFCTHVFDYCSCIAAAAAERIYCRTFSRISVRPDGSGRMRTAPAANETDIVMSYVNGVTATMLVSNTAPGGIGHRIEVYGERGCACFLHRPPFAHNEGRVTVQTVAGSTRELSLPAGDADTPTDSRIPTVQANLRDFFSVLAGGMSARLAGFPEALAARRVAAAAATSDQIGVPVAVEHGSTG